MGTARHTRQKPREGRRNRTIHTGARPAVGRDDRALLAGTDRVQVNGQNQSTRVRIFLSQVRLETSLVSRRAVAPRDVASGPLGPARVKRCGLWPAQENSSRRRHATSSKNCLNPEPRPWRGRGAGRFGTRIPVEDGLLPAAWNSLGPAGCRRRAGIPGRVAPWIWTLRHRAGQPGRLPVVRGQRSGHARCAGCCACQRPGDSDGASGRRGWEVRRLLCRSRAG